MSNKQKKRNKLAKKVNKFGSSARIKWIENWLDTNKDKSYFSAIKAYVQYKKEIVNAWTKNVEELLAQKLPRVSGSDFNSGLPKKDFIAWLIPDAANNVSWIRNTVILTPEMSLGEYKDSGSGKIKNFGQGWVKDKYVAMLSGDSRTINWMKKLADACASVFTCKKYTEIPDLLHNIEELCISLSNYRCIGIFSPLCSDRQLIQNYKTVAERLGKYRKFVENEICKNSSNLK